jgi:hypothetical protein
MKKNQTPNKVFLYFVSIREFRGQISLVFIAIVNLRPLSNENQPMTDIVKSVNNQNSQAQKPTDSASKKSGWKVKEQTE